jgi:predicted RNA-binding Zn-ribbon protein involved in translation (DUF1610 family)
MTRVEAFGRDESRSDDRSVARHPKRILFCSNCGHESPPAGDWIVIIRERTIDLSCPDCRTHLTTRWRSE